LKMNPSSPNSAAGWAYNETQTFGCLAAVLLAGYVTLRLTAPRLRLTYDNIEAIEEGMTEKEVEMILGAPAGNYSFLNSRDPADLLPCYDKPGDKLWVTDQICLGVRFDAAGKVTTFDYYRYRTRSFFAKIRDWLGL
jgi:hypothetical protein